jgi:TRAP-type uncharacterized transport system substrate-binding protein
VLEPSLQTQIIVTRPGIYDITDLDGQRLAMRTPELQKYVQAALDAHDIEFIPVYIFSQKDLLDSLKYGVIDAGLIGIHLSSDLQTVVDSQDAKILPWSNAAIQAVVDGFPEVQATILPADTYSGQSSNIAGFTIYQ